MVELEGACALVDEFFLRINGYHIGDEHIVRTQFHHLHHLALDAQRRLFY